MHYRKWNIWCLNLWPREKSSNPWDRKDKLNRTKLFFSCSSWPFTEVILKNLSFIIHNTLQNCFHMKFTVQSMSQLWNIYRVSQEERARLRVSVPYVKLYRYNPKHLYPKLKVTEIMAREKWRLLWCPSTVNRPWRHTPSQRVPGNETP
jgi:hypothetical protein